MVEKIVIVAFAIAALSCSSHPFRRDPSRNVASDISNFRIATRKVGDSTKLVILAKNNRNSDNTITPGSFATDLALKYGFQGKDLGNVDPVMLIVMRNGKVQTIHSFESGNFPPATVDEATAQAIKKLDEQQAEYGGPVHRARTLIYPEEYASLPPEFIDVPNAKAELIAASARSAFARGLSLAGGPTMAPLGVFLTILDGDMFHVQEQQADYFAHVVDSALTNHSPQDLIDAVGGEDALRDIGGALNTLYSPFGLKEKALLIPTSARAEKYDQQRSTRLSTAYENSKELIARCKQAGLICAGIGPQVVIAYLDRSKITDPTDLVEAERVQAPNYRLLQGEVHPELIEEEFKNIGFERGTLVPVRVYVTDEQREHQMVLDIFRPRSVKLQQMLNGSFNALKSIGIAAADSTPISLGVRIGSGLLSFIVRKSGQTWFDYKIRSYGEFLAIMDSGIQFDTSDILVEALLPNLDQYGFSPEEIEYYKNALKHIDPAKVKSALSDLAGPSFNTTVQNYSDDLATADQKRRQEIMEQIFSRMAKEEAKGGTIFGHTDPELRIRNKTVHLQRLLKWIAQEETKRAPSSKGRTLSSAEKKPIIILQVDGLRPDRLHEEMDRCKIRTNRDCIVPNLTDLLSSSTEMKSFASRSLTYPSWNTLLTGYEPDEHGVRSNSPATKADGGKIEGFTDARPELGVKPEYIEKGRSYRMLLESGIDWLARYYNEDEVVFNFQPISDGRYPPVLELVKRYIKKFADIANGLHDAHSFYDHACIDDAISKIQSNPGQYKLVMNWFTTIDGHSHKSNDLLRKAMENLDIEVGRLISAAKNDPVLKNAIVMLISDHGHAGGWEPSGSLGPRPEYVINSKFQLTEFFAGDQLGYNQYRFVVLANKSPEPKFDILFLKEFFIEPFSVDYRGIKKDREGDRSLMVDSNGDNLASVYVKHPLGGWDRHLNFAELSNFRNDHFRIAVNIPSDLMKLKYDPRELVAPDYETKVRIAALTGGHPVNFFAMTLYDKPGDRTVIDSAHAITSFEQIPNMVEREPILVRKYDFARDRFLNALIFTLSDGHSSSDLFRYVVVRNFFQDLDGKISGSVSTSKDDDPLGYLGSVELAKNPKKWYHDREWLLAAQDHLMPTVVFGVPRVLTVSPFYGQFAVRPDEARARRAKENPDFIVVSNVGFDFNSDDNLESDHGGFFRQEVRNTFYVTGLGDNRISFLNDDGSDRQIKLSAPNLTRDFFATVADYGGLGKFGEGKSLRPSIDAETGRSPASLRSRK